MEKTRTTLDIDEIKKHPKNPKRHNDKLIEESIKDLGYVDDIIVDENNVILAGHGRLDALKKLDYKKVDVIRISGWSEIQKERFMLLSNKSVESGGWDNEKLKMFEKDFLKNVGFQEDEFTFFEEKLSEINQELKPYKKTHILLSFPPDKFLKIKKFIDEILKIGEIEYEQGSN